MLTLRGRHINQGAVFITHHPTSVPDYVRFQIDCVLCFNHPSEAAAKYMEYWFGKTMTKKIPNLRVGEHLVWTKEGKYHQKRCGK